MPTTVLPQTPATVPIDLHLPRREILPVHDAAKGDIPVARPWLLIGSILLVLASGCDREEAAIESPAPVPNPVVRDPEPLPQTAPTTAGTAELVADEITSHTRFGVPIYPGARQIESGRWRMTDALAEGADALTFIALDTADGLDQVAAFYRERIDAAPEQSFEINNASGRTVSLTTTPDELASVNIVLRSRSGKTGTRIEINRLSLDAARAVPDK